MGNARTFSKDRGKPASGFPRSVISTAPGPKAFRLHAYSPPADLRERFFRSDSPESSTRCALCTSRSRMLSAAVGSPIWACQGETTQGPIRFPEDYEDKWVIFFSHPADFTPVCTTEFMTFASMQGEFRALNCELAGLRSTARSATSPGCGPSRRRCSSAT